jgi:hypothetical protein
MDKNDIDSLIVQKFDKENFLIEIENVLEKNILVKATFGFDVYKYSKMNNIQQLLLSYLLEHLISATCEHIKNYESYFFTDTEIKYLNDTKISTGDGYYLFFENPLLAIIFAIYFNSNLQRINSNYPLFSHISDILGTISIRYCITYDELFNYNNVFWGKGIINCARILSLDKLNRFLIDNKSYDWFIKNTNGIETLKVLDHKDLELFKKNKTGQDYESIVFSDDQKMLKCINTLDVQKLGNHSLKEDVFDIYNVYLQSTLTSQADTFIQKYVCSLGNTSSFGL